MKALFSFFASTLLLLVCACAASPQCSIAQSPARPSQEPRWEIITSYYSDEDRTVVMLRKMRYGTDFSYCEPLLIAEFSYKGRAAQPPETVALGFITNEIRESELVFTADGERFDLGRLKMREDMHQGNECEALIRRFAVSIPREIFRRIFAARKIEVRAGDRPLPLSEEHFAALRDLASRMNR